MESLKQSGKDWLEWRRQGIGSSDAAAVMSVSPWKTPYQLWEEKTSDEIQDEKSWAMIRGTEMEPIARAHYELTHDVEMKPTLMIHPELSFIRCSLDGYNAELKRVLEIKCVGLEDHALALKGIVPDKYVPQIFHQLLVTGAETAHYYSFDGVDGALVEVHRDEDYMKELLQKEMEFWDLVQNKIPPAYTDRDFVPIEDEQILSNIERWKEAKKEINELEAVAKMLREEIESRMTTSRSRGLGVRIVKVKRKGAIDYSKIADLQNVDLEKYRKKGTEHFMFTVEE